MLPLSKLYEPPQSPKKLLFLWCSCSHTPGMAKPQTQNSGMIWVGRDFKDHPVPAGAPSSIPGCSKPWTIPGMQGHPTASLGNLTFVGMDEMFIKNKPGRELQDIFHGESSQTNVWRWNVKDEFSRQTPRADAWIRFFSFRILSDSWHGFCLHSLLLLLEANKEEMKRR